jgi:hypothetical protein
MRRGEIAAGVVDFCIGVEVGARTAAVKRTLRSVPTYREAARSVR